MELAAVRALALDLTARAAVRYGFVQLGLPALVSMTVPANVRLLCVMTKLGFVRDPSADFEHPSIPAGDPKRAHWLFRLAAVAFVGCAHPAPAPAPTPIANHVEAPRTSPLDQLAFLDGCWRHWSVDWGFRTCWHRDRDAWVGTITSSGGMGPQAETTLRIVADGGDVALDVGGERIGEWLPVHARVSSRAIGDGHVLFATADQIQLELTLAGTTLHFRPWAAAVDYTLERAD